jgi:hypothetical protein
VTVSILKRLTMPRDESFSICLTAPNVRIDEYGPSIGPIRLLKMVSNEYVARTPIELEAAFCLVDPGLFNFELWHHSLDIIACAWNAGDKAKAAICLAQLTIPLSSKGRTRLGDCSWADLTRANFNPAELRSHGRWSLEGGSPYADDTSHVRPAAYNGSFHNEQVRKFAAQILAAGGKAVTEIELTGINGVTMRADAIIWPLGWPGPYVLEIKTGENPDFTIPQQLVLPLICQGYHVLSIDQRISQFGPVPGALLKAMPVYLLYIKNESSPVKGGNYCTLIGH